MDTEVASRRQTPSWVRPALELGPLVLFFGANWYAGIFVATGVLMAALVVALGISWWLERRLPTVPLVTAVIALLLGGLTLTLRDELFIKIKATLVYGLLASVLLGGLLLGRSLLAPLFGSSLVLAPEGWRRLTLRTGAFFVLLALLNEALWRNCSTDTWVAFKTWGFLPLTFAFFLSQGGLIRRYSLDPEPARSSPEDA